MEKTTSESWLQHIAVWGESGLNKAEFCRQAGLPYQKFCYHCRRAGKAASAGKAIVPLAPTQPTNASTQLSNTLTCDNASTESWAQRIAAYEKSALSKAEFCRQAGLHYQKFCSNFRRAEIAASAENVFVALAPAQLAITSAQLAIMAAQLTNALTCDNAS